MVRIKLEEYIPFLLKALDEIERDFTSFGSPPVIWLLVVIIGGFSFFTVTVLAGLIVLEFLCSIIKLVFPKDRPEKEEYKNRLEKIDAQSFPSVHTARSTYACFALISFLQTPSSFLFAVLPVFVAVTRVRLQKHFWTDVIAGIIFGSIFFFVWHKIVFP